MSLKEIFEDELPEGIESPGQGQIVVCAASDYVHLPPGFNCFHVEGSKSYYFRSDEDAEKYQDSAARVEVEITEKEPEKAPEIVDDPSANIQSEVVETDLGEEPEPGEESENDNQQTESTKIEK